MRSISLELLRREWISESSCSPDILARVEANEDNLRILEGVLVPDNISDFAARMLDSDELRTFRNSPEAWKRGHGRMGFVILRDGEPVDAILTAMN